MDNKNSNFKKKKTDSAKKAYDEASEKLEHVKNRVSEDYKKVKNEVAEGAQKLKDRTDESARHMHKSKW